MFDFRIKLILVEVLNDNSLFFGDLTKEELMIAYKSKKSRQIEIKNKNDITFGLRLVGILKAN